MKKHNKNPIPTILFPDNFISSFTRNVKDLLGILLITISLLLALSLYYYDPIDLSFNTASDKNVLNVLGVFGSYTSDFFWQLFGLGSYLIILILFVWGVRLFLRHPIRFNFFRILGLFLSPLLLSIILQKNNGVFTYLILNALHAQYQLAFLLRPILCVSFLMGIICLWWTIGLSFGQFLQLCRWINQFLIIKIFNPKFTQREEPRYRQDHRLNSNKTSLSDLIKKNKNEEEVRGQTLDRVLTKNDGEYQFPPLDLFDPISQKNFVSLTSDDFKESAEYLEKVLEEFGVKGEIVNIRPGPVVTMYELKPAPGIKTSRVIGLADDIARSMSAISARIAVIPGQNVIGIELPNRNRQTVFMRNLLISKEYSESSANLLLILGQDIGGNPTVADLAKMPHLLVAGTTGSGKSVSVNAMILSLLLKLPPDQCKLIMIDPKMLELSVYDGIPHLLTPVVTDPKKAIVALKWAVKEMESRYRSMSKLGVRNIDGYNSRLKAAREKGEVLARRVQTGFDPDSGIPIFENQTMNLEPFPYIVIVVDEMADLMLVAGKEIELAVQRLAQMARAAGIHLIMATQRPSVDVITGTIKANFPTRISFQVTSKIDSRTILSEQGAEQLLGQGDMLYMVGGGKIMRIHGPFVKDIEVERVVSFLKTQGEPSYIDSVIEDDEEQSLEDVDSGGSKGNDLYHQAIDLVLREGKVSTSFIQRHLQIGYNRAARIVEQMEKEGIISPANHVGKREILER